MRGEDSVYFTIIPNNRLKQNVFNINLNLNYQIIGKDKRYQFFGKLP